MRITKSYSMNEKDVERIEKLKSYTLIKSDSKLTRLAVRYCLFNVKGFLRFLNHGKDEEL